MKNCIMLVAFLTTTGLLYAQPKIMSAEEFKNSGQTYEQLATEYDSKPSGESLAQLGNSLEVVVRDVIVVSQQTNFLLSLNVYVNTLGKIDRVLYDIQAANDTKQSLQKILEEELPVRLDSWQINGMEGKKLTFWKFIRHGQPPTTRSERKGDSLISSLEAARAIVDTLRIKALHLHQLDLAEVPYDLIYRFPNLETLDLQKNKLTELNLDLGKLPKLKQLDVHTNELTTTSLRLTENRTLKILNLHSNRLTDVPAAARACKQLESLWIGGNKDLKLSNKSFRKLRTVSDLNLYKCGLSTLPRGMRKLRDLEVLDLYYNAFTELPRTITNLKKLNQLAVSNNQLTALPTRLYRLKRLQVLYAHHNHLSTLPDRMTRMGNLYLLDLGYNFYSTLPQEVLALTSLRELDLSGNNFTSFPSQLSEVPYLEKLHLRGNPFLKHEKEQAYLPYIKKLEKNPTEVFY